MISKEDLESRVEKSVELFKSGFNCSQSVFGAFADLYDIDKDVALRISSSFGGGIGRMRQTCGAACGMFLLAGLEKGTSDGSNSKAKAENYSFVQSLAEEFKKRNGSLICAELLGLKKPEGTPVPAERNAEYYKKRPCVEMVREAAKIYAQYLENKLCEK